MRGICINAATSMVLQEGFKYFLFEHGENNYYVSKFDNPGAHCGSYEKKFFEVVAEQQEEPNEVIGDEIYYFNENPDIPPVIVPIKPTIKLKRYVAQVAKYRNGYNVGDLFIITEKNENGFYHVYLKDQPAKNPIGSYISNFFEIITEYDEIETARITKQTKPAHFEPIKQPAIKTLTKDVASENKREQKPNKKLRQSNQDQLTIFDFLEG